MNLAMLDFETAKDLKELGFDWPCQIFYEDSGTINSLNHSYAKLKYFEDTMEGKQIGSDYVKLDTNWNKFNFIGETLQFYTDEILQEYFTINCSAPEQALVVKWFRDIHKLSLEVVHHWFPNNWEAELFIISDKYSRNLIYGIVGNTYEEAELEGIKASIKYLKENGKQ